MEEREFFVCGYRQDNCRQVQRNPHDIRFSRDKG